MALVVHNPFGQDAADFNEETSADRIGRRIRAIRIEKGLSQAELGQAMGLTADRIQKYENGARKPKFDMLKQFARVLGVETIALMDPVVSNYIGAMFAFFEMEELYELEVKKDGAKYSLQFGNGFTGTMNEYLKEWYEERQTVRTRMENASDEEKEAILREYHEWEKTFPKALSDRTEKALQKARLENTIAELQEKLDRLDEE
jgi:transcriptional regulator with XRE-family HTH domain